MKIHFIAIGGSAMHNLAIAMKHKGYEVTGSDDEIKEPSLSRLSALNILPPQTGWFPEKITPDIHAIILGMHARSDNPELMRAKELRLQIFSYPEYLYEQSKDKTRVVIGGSHGKTTITAMVMHTLKNASVNFDYMAGAKVQGFDTMVKLTPDAKFIVIEGDEYLASPIDRRPKFHLYKPHIALLTGIAWDHINVFPTFENYVEQFEIFIDKIEEGGQLFYCSNDPHLQNLVRNITHKIHAHPYSLPKHKIVNGKTILITPDAEIPLRIFGDHNLMNLEGARLLCKSMGVPEQQFYSSVQNFEGASGRLEYIRKESHFAMFKDFAHSPSKLKATIAALRKQFPDRKLIACMELHTFSSLNKEFLNEYAGSMDDAHEPIVYFNPHTLSHKQLQSISKEEVKSAFNRNDLTVFTDSSELSHHLEKINYMNCNLLMMSSGTFDGINLLHLSEKLVF